MIILGFGLSRCITPIPCLQCFPQAAAVLQVVKVSMKISFKIEMNEPSLDKINWIMFTIKIRDYRCLQLQFYRVTVPMLEV